MSKPAKRGTGVAAGFSPGYRELPAANSGAETTAITLQSPEGPAGAPDAAQGALATVSSELAHAEAVIAELTEVGDAAQAAIDMLRGQLQGERAEAQTAAVDHTAVAEELYAQTVSSRIELEMLGAELDAALVGAEARAGAAEASLVESRAELVASEARAGAADAGLAESRAELTRLRERVDHAERDARRRDVVEVVLRGEIESLGSALNRTERQMRRRSEEVETLRVERGAAVETLKAEIASLYGDLSAAEQVARALMAAATEDHDAPQKPNRLGGARSAMLGFGRAMRARAIRDADRARNARRWQEAARRYRKALAWDPFDPPILVQYGHALKEAGHLPEAEAAYRRSLVCDPGVADTHLQLGHVLKLQGRTTAAQAAYLRAFALDPLTPLSMQELAGLGWSPMHVSQLCKLNATSGISQLRSLREAADAARDRRDWPSAAKFYGQLVAADPTAHDIAVQLGHALKEMGDIDRAATAYYTALDASPLDGDLRLHIGHLEEVRGNLAQAAAHYKRAAEINPDNADPRRRYEALRSRIGEVPRTEESETEPGQDRANGDEADRHMRNEFGFGDARAGHIYRQLVSALV